MIVVLSGKYSLIIDEAPSQTVGLTDNDLSGKEQVDVELEEWKYRLKLRLHVAKETNSQPLSEVGEIGSAAPEEEDTSVEVTVHGERRFCFLSLIHSFDSISFGRN